MAESSDALLSRPSGTQGSASLQTQNHPPLKQARANLDNLVSSLRVVGLEK